MINGCTIFSPIGEIRGKDAGLAMMTELFFVIVTDNGTEFTLPDEIEKDCESNKVADPSSSLPPKFTAGRGGQRLELGRGLLPVGRVAVDLELERAHLPVRLREVRRGSRIEQLRARLV